MNENIERNLRDLMDVESIISEMRDKQRETAPEHGLSWADFIASGLFDDAVDEINESLDRVKERDVSAP